MSKILIEIDDHNGVIAIFVNGVRINNVKQLHVERHKSFIEVQHEQGHNPLIALDAGLEIRIAPAERLQ